MAYRLARITPFVPCSTLARQVGFYCDLLGFTVGFQARNYAFLQRGDVAIRLIEVAAGIDLTAPEREMSFYIDVEGIDALYRSPEPGLSTLPEGRVRGPFNQDYGQREFHVLDEDCTLVFFGQAIDR